MPRVELVDGRILDIVKPSVQEKIAAQTHVRKAFKMTPTDMVEVMQSVEWLSMLPLFATLLRAGVEVRMNELLEDEAISEWMPRLSVAPGEVPESEGEERPDPPSEATVGGAVTGQSPLSSD